MKNGLVSHSLFQGKGLFLRTTLVRLKSYGMLSVEQDEKMKSLV